MSFESLHEHKETIYYYVRTVRTPFPGWLGCATKLCKGRKRNKVVCHIRPESKVFPIGNGLYECDQCHKSRPRTKKEMYLPADYKEIDINSNRMSKEEVWWLQEHLRALSPAPLVVKYKEPNQFS